MKSSNIDSMRIDLESISVYIFLHFLFESVFFTPHSFRGFSSMEACEEELSQTSLCESSGTVTAADDEHRSNPKEGHRLF